ncbi:unnamed protein product [Paramecium sonneborni]|uniref:Uncharacterized protein n=1 Tax=Paramecium sonneborni TaxID=65129 RepID=A0A8S1PUI9_9CILI|nr:unnamed protein product [Paramecium sonneborni]
MNENMFFDSLFLNKVTSQPKKYLQIAFFRYLFGFQIIQHEEYAQIWIQQGVFIYLILNSFLKLEVQFPKRLLLDVFYRLND